MRIAVPRERKAGECRVAITPDGAAQLVQSGHEVLIETRAGTLSGLSDKQYQSSGAKIIPSLKELWLAADLLVKVKEPAPEELELFRKDLAVFSFLHPAVAPELTHAMLEHQVIGLDYDLLADDQGRLPILRPMSIIAGKLSIQCGADALLSSRGGCGVLLGGVPGVKPGKVLVVGAGAAGGSAALVAAGIGASVTIIDINTERLAEFANSGIKTVFNTPQALAREIATADLVIGAVLIPGSIAPKLISRALVKTMKPGSVLVDICIDQGGVSETSRLTTISEPTYVEHGVVHYCVPNMPALVPNTSTYALTNATIPWIRRIADQGVFPALVKHRELLRSLVALRGKLTNPEIGEAHNIAAIGSTAISELIATASAGA